MSERFSRTAMLLGEEALKKLQGSHIAVFGIGGVGSYTAEALVRGGVGKITVVDSDIVSESNINRQLFATCATVGESKVEVAAKRLCEINPNVEVIKRNEFFLPENAANFDFSQYDYVVDAVDTVKAKLALVECCESAGVPIICAMGAGNKLDPTAFTVADIYKTTVCPLARVMREQLKKRGIKKLKVVYSKEKPLVPHTSAEEIPDGCKRHSLPGSVSFVPPVVGMIMAGEVIKDITSVHGNGLGQ